MWLSCIDDENSVEENVITVNIGAYFLPLPEINMVLENDATVTLLPNENISNRLTMGDTLAPTTVSTDKFTPVTTSNPTNNPTSATNFTSDDNDSE